MLEGVFCLKCGFVKKITERIDYETVIEMDVIKLLVYDFDGVMTNNKVLINMVMNLFMLVVQMVGIGVSKIKKLGIAQIIISTRKTLSSQQEQKKLISPVFKELMTRK